jgi:hypothetical protein
MAKPKKQSGRPEVYDPAMLERLAFLAEDPRTLSVRGRISNAALGKFLGVSKETVRKWLDRAGNDFKEEFCKAVNEMQTRLNAGDIKRSMIEKARGYTQVKTICELREDDDGEEKMKVVKTEKVIMSGDVAAAKLVLPNIEKGRTDAWDVKDKSEMDMTGDLLIKLSEEIDGSGRQLPEDENRTDGQESEGSLLAIK